MNATVAKVRGELRSDERMSRHTVWAVGGSAATFFKPADLEDLTNWLQQRDGVRPVFWLGLGSNLLVRDGGINADVVATAGTLGQIDRFNGASVRMGAGAPCAKVARVLAREGLAGGEFLAGIPGTMGGALAMNAGAHGGETWGLVTRVQTISRDGITHWREPTEFNISYRSVEGEENEWFIACELRLTPSDPEQVREATRSLLAHRASTQPIGQRSCGSVFRNPPGDYAGRLIEAAGLKGRRCGGAVVSDKHANFILNDGGASAADIEQLIEEVRSSVQRRSGVELISEVRVVGEA